MCDQFDPNSSPTTYLYFVDFPDGDRLWFAEPDTSFIGNEGSAKLIEREDGKFVLAAEAYGLTGRAFDTLLAAADAVRAAMGSDPWGRIVVGPECPPEVADWLRHRCIAEAWS